MTIYTATKAKWTIRITNTTYLVSPLTQLHNSTLIHTTELTNLRTERNNIHDSLKQTQPYILENLLCLYDLKNKSQPAKNLHTFMTSYIWHNLNITHNKKTLYLKHWISVGLTHVHHLFDHAGSFKDSLSIFRILRNRTNWLSEFSIVKKAIAKYQGDLKIPPNTVYKNPDQNVILIKGKSTDSRCLSQQQIYRHLLVFKSEPNICQEYMARRFNSTALE